MAEIVIIGAGLTGLSAAYHFEKQHVDYVMFEKESQPGGLCRSVTQDGFTFDYTGHLLHISDPYFKSLLEKIYGFENFNTISRRAYIYSQNIYTRYPYQINLYGLPAQTIIDCITQFVTRPHIEQPQTFREWVLSSFGQGFGDHFFFPYQQKIFATPIDELTASWTQRFVPSTSLEKILLGSLQDSVEDIGYNAQFYYPKQGGIFSWIKALAHAVRSPIYTDYTVSSIDIARKIISFTNGHEQSYTNLISTMPLDRLLACIKEPSSSSLKTAQSKLRCNKVININLGFDHPVSDHHWIYFPENKYPFYRLGFHHNFAASMAPEGCGSLYGEIAHINQPQEWIDNAITQSKKEIKKLLSITDKQIITEKTMHISHAYVIYDQWRDANLPTLIKTLNSYDIYPAGRYGAWKYSSMQEAVLDGKQIAEQLSMPPAPLLTHHQSERFS